MRDLRAVHFGLILALVLSAGVAGVSVPAVAAVAGVQAQDAENGTETPSREQVYVILRDMELEWETVRLQTIVPNEAGASALVALSDGTLADVELMEVSEGWSLRDIFYVAGSADTFRSWSAPWERRVSEAERFVAASSDRSGADVSRRARELAPMVWFESGEDTRRLWGLNPVTYRMMHTLKMMPSLGGPIGGSNNPRFNR